VLLRNSTFLIFADLVV